MQPSFPNTGWATTLVGCNGAAILHLKISLTLSPSVVVWPTLHAAFQLPHIELPLSCLALCRYVFCYASDDPSHAGGSGAGRPRSRAPRGHDLRPHRLSSCPQLEVLGEDEDRPESWSG